jgi:hypothetical protein
MRCRVNDGGTRHVHPRHSRALRLPAVSAWIPRPHPLPANRSPPCAPHTCPWGTRSRSWPAPAGARAIPERGVMGPELGVWAAHALGALPPPHRRLRGGFCRRRVLSTVPSAGLSSTDDALVTAGDAAVRISRSGGAPCLAVGKVTATGSWSDPGRHGGGALHPVRRPGPTRRAGDGHRLRTAFGEDGRAARAAAPGTDLDGGMELAGHMDVTAATGLRCISPTCAARGSAAPTRTPTSCCGCTFQRRHDGRSTQDDLDQIAAKLKTPPRETLEFQTPADRLAALSR